MTATFTPAAGFPPPDPDGRAIADDRDHGQNGGVTDSGDSVSPREASTDDGPQWPFDSWQGAVRWWFAPLTDPRTWLTLAHLFVGMILGPIWFAVAVTVIAVIFGLSFVAVGLLLVPLGFAAIRGLAAVERRRAEWIGAPIPQRRLAESDGGWWRAISVRLGDPARWKLVAYLLAGVIAGPAFFVIGAFLWFAAGEVAFEFGTFEPARFVVGVVMLGGAAHWTRLFGRAVHEYTAWFLGPDREAELEERVEVLSTQREQILDAVAGERRRIERNLHDGVQQQLVALGIDIGRAEARLADDPDGARELLADAKTKVRSSIGELRLIGRGLHPAVLGDRGLDAALSAVVADAPIPISVDVSTERELPDHVAETAYYIVNESVANVLKYAKARAASVRVIDEPGLLPAVRIEVHDDGRGGADPAGGSGLAGIKARVEGVDGAFALSSPDGGPTIVTAVIPIRRSRVVDGQPRDSVRDVARPTPSGDES